MKEYLADTSIHVLKIHKILSFIQLNIGEKSS